MGACTKMVHKFLKPVDAHPITTYVLNLTDLLFLKYSAVYTIVPMTPLIYISNYKIFFEICTKYTLNFSLKSLYLFPPLRFQAQMCRKFVLLTYIQSFCPSKPNQPNHFLIIHANQYTHVFACWHIEKSKTFVLLSN